MSIQSTATASAINLLLAGIYYIGRRKKVPSQVLFTQMSGVVLASIMNSTRPFTERYLKQWFEERHLNYIYGASSIVMIGLSSHYAKLSMKTNVTATLLFTTLQTGAHKLSVHLYQEQLEIEARERTRNHHRKESTFLNANYLRTELFPDRNPLGNRNPNSSAYLYVLPEGFLVFLADNNGLPFFSDRMGSIDSSEVCKLQEEYCHTLTLSAEAMDRLRHLAQQVTFDGAPQAWDLQGIPPFICIEGTWNPDLNPHGTQVNWEDLVTRSLSQQHQAFELNLLPATWTTRPETPNLRGFSFNHTEARFNIWVHERNTNAFECEVEELTSQVNYFESLIQFLKDFEKASFTFNSTGSLPLDRRGRPDYNALQEWGNLISRIPFPHLRNRYPNLPELTRAYRRSPTNQARDDLIRHFEVFFRTLPQEAHVAVDAVCAGQFNECFNGFHSAGNDLVRNDAYINTNKLKEWLSMLQLVAYHFGTSPQLTQLINESQEYLNVNNALRRQPADPDTLRARRTELDPILKEGYILFFQTYEPVMRSKGQYIGDLDTEIRARENKQRRLHDFVNQIRNNDGTLKVTNLNAWVETLELPSIRENLRCQQLLQDSRTYLRDHLRKSIHPITQEWLTLTKGIVAGYFWFFKTYFPAHNPDQKYTALIQLAQHADSPRSYTESTAQIAYYSPLDQKDLYALVRRNCSRQIGNLTGAIQSHLNDHHNDCELPEAFCARFIDIYQRTGEFIVRKAQNLKTLQQDWTLDGTIKHEKRVSDGSEYQFNTYESRNAREASRLLTEITQSLFNLHTLVNQADEAAYLASPFLAEETALGEELYSLTNEMFFLLKVPLRWNLHQQLHEHSSQTHKAKNALAEGGNYHIYKRIGDGGLVHWDIVRVNETSELEKRNAVHTAIYCH